jgi:PAS domain S-box-containing protein
MHRLLKVITSGWQFPEITSVQIVISGKKYETENFKKSPWMQVEERMTGSGERVLLSIAYSEEKPLESEGLFFKEERKLVRAIINRIVDTLNLRSKEAIIFERNELINLMFSQTTDSIGIFDPVLNKFIEFNENAYKDLGYAKEEFALLTPDQFQAEYSAELIKENIQRVSKGQKASFETQHKKKNGELQEAKVTLTPINNYGKPFICVVWHDITEQKRQLKEQQEANAKLIQHAQIIRKISSMKSGIDGDIYSFTRDITVLIADDMKIDRVSFWELNEERTVFECIDLYLQDQKVHSKGTLITEKEFPGFFDMISSNLILSISNISTDPRAREFFEGYMKPKGIMSLMAYPVFFSGNIIGFIGISQKKRARFMEK